MNEVEDLQGLLERIMRVLGPLELLVIADLFYQIADVFDTAGEEKRDEQLARTTITKRFTVTLNKEEDDS